MKINLKFLKYYWQAHGTEEEKGKQILNTTNDMEIEIKMLRGGGATIKPSASTKICI